MAAAAPFVMKAAPYIASGVGSLIGKKLSGPSGDQQAAMEGQRRGAENLEGAAAPLLQQGAGMVAEGGRGLGDASAYYRNILSSRRGAAETLAPETTTALEYYRGAENKAKRTLSGGSRDYALAELDRQKVGQIAGFLPSARANAAEGMERIGGTQIQGGASLTGQGANALANAGYLRSGLFNNATTIRDQEAEGGAAWGKMMFDIFNGMQGLGGKKPLPSTNLPVPIYTGPKL